MLMERKDRHPVHLISHHLSKSSLGNLNKTNKICLLKLVLEILWKLSGLVIFSLQPNNRKQ